MKNFTKISDCKKLIAYIAISLAGVTQMSVSASAQPVVLGIFDCRASQKNAFQVYPEFISLFNSYCSGNKPNPTSSPQIVNYERCMNFAAANNCVLDSARPECFTDNIVPDALKQSDPMITGQLYLGNLSSGPSGQLGTMIRSLGLTCKPNINSNACYFQTKDQFNAERARQKSEIEYNKLLDRYEDVAQKKENALLKIVNNISRYDGQITALLGKMLIEGVTSLTNKITCNDASFASFCNRHPGRFAVYAGQWSTAMSKKRAETLKLSGTEKIHGSRLARAYNRAVNAWLDLSSKITMESAAGNRLRACLGDTITPAGLSCSNAVPAGATASDPRNSNWYEVYRKASIKAGSSSSTVVANSDPGCPTSPGTPTIINQSGDGCYSLFGGFGEAIGATICGNKLVNSVM